MTDASSAPDMQATIASLAAAHPELEIRARQAATPSQKVWVWIIGSVVAALVPIGFTALHNLDHTKSADFYAILGKGELLLIAITISIAGLAELVLTVRQVRPSQTFWVALLLIGNVLLVAGAALWYGDLSSAALEAASSNLVGGAQADPSMFVAWGSIISFVIAAAISSACVWVTAGVER